MKTIPILALICSLSIGCTQSGRGRSEVTGRDIGGQTQGTSFPGSTGAGSQDTTGSVGGGRSNYTPGSSTTKTGGSR